MLCRTSKSVTCPVYYSWIWNSKIVVDLFSFRRPIRAINEVWALSRPTEGVLPRGSSPGALQELQGFYFQLLISLHCGLKFFPGIRRPPWNCISRSRRHLHLNFILISSVDHCWLFPVDLQNCVCIYLNMLTSIVCCYLDLGRFCEAVILSLEWGALRTRKICFCFQIHTTFFENAVYLCSKAFSNLFILSKFVRLVVEFYIYFSVLVMNLFVVWLVYFVSVSWINDCLILCWLQQKGEIFTKMFLGCCGSFVGILIILLNVHLFLKSK